MPGPGAGSHDQRCLAGRGSVQGERATGGEAAVGAEAAPGRLGRPPPQARFRPSGVAALVDNQLGPVAVQRPGGLLTQAEAGQVLVQD